MALFQVRVTFTSEFEAADTEAATAHVKRLYATLSPSTTLQDPDADIFLCTIHDADTGDLLVDDIRWE